MSKLFGIIIAAAVLCFVVLGIVLHYSYNNDYVRLKNQYEAQVDVDRAIYDEVWKVIKQQAGVSEKYSQDFKNNYAAIMEGRNYGGETMKWITESNPTFTPDLYSKLMNTIESQRAKFTTNQKKMISIHKELKDLVMVFPGSFFLSGKDIPELKLVTSTRTEKSFTTGKDDDVGLFDNK